ncbi:hypothetical protein MMC28_003790 [Mycoblastus sanguinarius]|nr:hypothetical protein [Mycoblastus sanguinarius]
MPFPGHQHSASAQPENVPGGPYQCTARPVLISGDLRDSNVITANADPNMAANDNSYLSSPNTLTSHSRGSSGQGFETPRQAQTYGRRPEELHIPPNAATSQQNPVDLPRHHSYHSSQEFAGGPAPGNSTLQATQHGSQYANTSGVPSLPGSLQPGRPGPSSSITAPSTLPTLPQVQNSTQKPTSATRPTTVTNAHSYSRSSPAGLDQPKYTPFNTPETAKYASMSTHRYNSSQTAQGDMAYSPLGLADIRPLTDAGLMDGPQSANPYSNNGFPAFPTKSNYLAPWAVYAFDWCKWPVQQQSSGDSAGKMAIGSYVEDGHNFIQILDTQVVAEPDPDHAPDAPQYGIEFVKTAEATHSYPVTRILWEPASSQKQSTDLLATSGDHLRLWSLPSQSSYNPNNSITRSSTTAQPPQKLTPLALLSNSKSPEHTAPLTSLDWNTLSPSLIITSSIDTTCTIWDIPTLTAKTQLIAHDKEVFDVRFCANSVDVFVSCGADGSVRMFDLRSLEHSTIIYEPSEKNNEKSSSPGNISPTTAQQTMSYAPPLLRLAASPHDAHLLATFSQDSNSIRILDVRQPGQALLELRGHAAAINCIEWSPSRRGTLASGGDDSLVLIWDLLNQGNATLAPGANGNPQAPPNSTPVSTQGPAASWQCDYEVGNMSWAPQSGLTSQGSDWLGVSGGRGIWGVAI